jgi:hypothetical protein
VIGFAWVAGGAALAVVAVLAALGVTAAFEFLVVGVALLAMVAYGSVSRSR